jgi:hypothetical protein
MSSRASPGGSDEYEDLREYADENREDLLNILRHGTDNFARGCALTALLYGSDRPELQGVIEILEKEVE